MSENRPNIVLIMTDQHRGDCLGIEGHPAVQTPFLDQIAAEGVRFSRGYSACPVCIPARRTLMTGQRPRTHGVVMNYATRLDAPTLPGELARAGYQTHLVGKLHLHPHRKLYGFTSADWSDGPFHPETLCDYQRYLWREGLAASRGSNAHGMALNGWAVRPWHMEERHHFTNWCTDRAVDFLERRDPTMPFFLKLSYLHPHEPLTPPRDYYDRYINMDLPEPFVGDWARVFERPQRGLNVESWRTSLDPIVMKQFRAAYYASVNHIDNQIGRVLPILPHNTIVVFTSDHGEMLGDHQWIRKRSPYEPSARIPMLMRFPKDLGLPQRQVISRPVELMDLMPTLLQAAGLDIPTTVEGRSVLPLLRGSSEWREYLHGECSHLPDTKGGMQYLTDGKRKYVWLPADGVEQFFDLEQDPNELVELSSNKQRQDEVAQWRARLIRELEGRPEGFVENGKLKRLAGVTPAFLPGFERK